MEIVTITLTNTTEKYIDLGQREALHSNNHIHVLKAVVLRQGVHVSPALGYLVISDTFLVVTAGVGKMCYWCLVGKGEGCCQISYNAQDSIQNKELSGPKFQSCWG